MDQLFHDYVIKQRITAEARIFKILLIIRCQLYQTFIDQVSPEHT